MSTGLAELLNASNEKAEQNYSKFLHTAGQLARGEDVPAKTLANVCEAAQKTPVELQDEVTKRAQPLVALVSKVEEARVTYDDAKPRFEHLAEVIKWVAAEEDAIVSRIVALEVLRNGCYRELIDVGNALRKAFEEEKHAREVLTKRGGDYGILVPAGLPDRPQPPAHLFQVDTKDWGLEMARFKVYQALDAMRRKPHSLVIPEKSVHQLFPVEQPETPATVTTPAPADTPAQVADVSDLPSLDSPDASVLDPFGFLSDAK